LTAREIATVRIGINGYAGRAGAAHIFALIHKGEVGIRIEAACLRDHRVV
jgi:hypothetical protein